jgi:methionine-rich copper-binding protein CopC
VCTQDSGCVTRVLACLHEHGDACGYAEGNPGAPCTFACPICPIEDFISRLPARVSAHNMEQVQAQLSEIYALYEELTGDEQRQVDLSPCVALLDQIDGMGFAVLEGGYNLSEDENYPGTFKVIDSTTFNTNGHTFAGTGPECAIRVTGTGKLYLTGGGYIFGKNGTGVEVESGGFLSIVDPTTRIKGMGYGLDIASGAEVHLSGGTYEGSTAAIRMANDNFGALLEDGCAYYDDSGNWLSPDDMATATKVIVKQCTDHIKECVLKKGLPTHTWTCLACGATGEEKCTFEFAQGITGTCGSCNNKITVTVDRNSLKGLAYDDTVKPENGTVTVRVKDATEDLDLDTDYTVDYKTQANVGDASFTVTVTVTGINYDGIFTADYTFTKDELEKFVLEWDTTSISVPVAVDYDGSPVEKADLPPVIINIQTSAGVDLHDRLKYSHRAQGSSDAYTDGLPTNAGTYDVVVTLPEGPDYQAASSDPITLTINKISPIIMPPAAAKPVYNGAEQELVTAGTLDPAAIADSLEIKFATNENGPYSTEIPKGTNAGDYQVWYKVEVTDNYTAVDPTEITGVEIQRKQLTPDVTLSEYTYLYDNGYKEPKVTVKDGELKTILPETEYQFEYVNNRNVSTPDNPTKVIVTDKAGGNYDLARVEVPFEITLRTQEALSITEKPNTVIYGDTFTLSTSGGSGDGLITWEIIPVGGKNVATVDQDSGQVTIIGDGEATVRATKSGKDPVTGVTNYEDAIATWPFTASKKAVTATVTADDKFYDTNTNATVHAVVKEGVLSGDEISITGLTGTFGSADAGVDKNVTVDITGAKITGKNSEHYTVSYSSTTVKATIHKAIAKITTAPAPATLTYDGTEQELIATGAVVDPTGVLVEYALSEDGPYSADFPKGTNAGEYTVWYRIQETANYTGEAPQSVKATIAKKQVNPTIELSGDGLTVEPDGTYSYVYDGTAKEPVVTLKEADGTTEIPAGEYTVAYSNNTNVGTATVTVTAKPGGNYSFENAPVTKTFEIQKEKAKVTTAPEAVDDLIFKTSAQKLVTAGTGAGGTMVYRVGPDGEFKPGIPTGTNAGSYTVYYKVEGDANHSDSEVGSVPVVIAPKPVNDPLIELQNDDGTAFVSCVYDGIAKEPKVVVKDYSTLIDAGEYEIRYANNIDAGNTATVNIIDKPNGNYTVKGSTTFVIEKANIVFDQDPSAAVITYDGKAHELLVPGKTSGGEVQYALNSAPSRYDTAIPTATEAGKYTVYYKVVGDKNHNDLAVQSVDVTIKRKPLTDITIELTPDSFEYDGKVKLPTTVTVKFKEGKTETVVPDTEYDWTCDNDSPTNQGTYTITITDATDGNYDLTGVTANTATFYIGKTAQAPLVIEDKPDSTIYGDTFTLTTSGGSSSSAVTWSATGPVTVDENTGEVEIIGVGEVTITATNPGDKNYLPVSDQWTFTASPKPVTASVVVGNRAYDGTTNAAVTSASIATINGDTVDIDPASITAAFDTPGVGTGKTVTLDISKVKMTGADAAKYDISYPDTVTADVTKATTTITAAPEGITGLQYTGAAQELITAGQTNVGFMVYSLDGTNFSPEVPTGTNAGTYTVYYKVDGTADYTSVAVNATPISVTIDPKSITPKIEPSEFSFLYDGTKKEPELTVLDGKTVIDTDQYTVTWANDDPAVKDGLLTAAGTYTATITNVANGNYSFTANATAEIVPAEQAAIEITGAPEHVYYGDRITSLGTSGGTGDGRVKWSVTAGGASAEIDEDSGVLTIKGTGSVTVKAERIVSNYGTVSNTWTFDVEPKPVVAEVTITAKVYDGSTDVDTAAINAVVKAGDLIDPGDAFTLSGLTGAYDNANAGTGKTVTLDDTNATKVDGNGKYAVSYPDTARGTINPRSVTVTVTLSGNDLQKDDSAIPPYFYNYDGTEKNPNVTVTANDNNAVLTASDYDVEIADNKNVGNATVTVTEKAGGNYTFTEEEVKFAIKKASAAWNTIPQAKLLTYDGTEQELVTAGSATGGTVVYSLEQDGTYGKAIPKKTEAGTYIVYYMIQGDANHEDTTPSPVSVTIKPKEITPTITLSGSGLTETNGVYSCVYDGTAKTPGVTVTGGTNTIDASEYSVSYRDNTNVGRATVIVSDNNGGNYIVNGTATFEITKKAPTFTAPVGITGLQYNGEAQELVTAGVCHEGTVEYSLNGGNYSTAIPVGTAVGTYTIDYKVLGDANHSDTGPVQLTVEIGKNKVTNPTITLSPPQFTYNGNPQEPAITVLDNNQREIPKHEYTKTITGTKSNNMVDVDTYTVTITTPSTSNYVITTDGTTNVRTFEIVPADQESISITGTKAQVHYGDTIQLGVSGGTGVGTIAWEIEAKDGSTVSSTISTTGLLTVTDVGGPYIVTVTRTKPNYDTVSAEWEFSAGKKPVTAEVTIAPKTFDGTTDVNDATITAVVNASDLVSGDSITISGLKGTYDSVSVGTKTVTLNSGNVTVTGTNWEKYDIAYPKTATGAILSAAATVGTAPTPNTLTYDASQAQELVTAGTVTGGTMVYSLDGTNFTAAIPKAKEAGKHTVWYKAQGDSNHTDSEAKSIEVTINQRTVASNDVQIELTPPSAKYDGNVKRPKVTVRDKENNVIPESEYHITYVSDNSENWTDKGTYKVKVENTAGGNYVVETATADFEINTSAQAPLEIVNKPGLVYYGDTFTLSAVGGSGNGKVTWSVPDAYKDIVEVDANGVVKINGTGPAEITATRAGGTNYGDATATYSFNAWPKPVTAIVTAKDRVYKAGDVSAELIISWKPGDLVGKDTIDTSNVMGTFKDDSVGTGKTVNITGDPVNDATAQKYDITIPPTTTASIFKADATVPTLTANDREYDGTTQDLVRDGNANTLYSSFRDGVYTAAVPTETNAGTYTVWYKAKGDANHNDSEPQSIQVTISKKTLALTDANVTVELSGNDLQTDTDGTYYYTYDGSEKKPSVIIEDGSSVIPAGEYTVSYSNNKNVSTDDQKATVTITNNEGGNYIVSGSVTFEIRKGGAELTGSPQAKDLTYTGQPQELVTVGSATGGHIEYALDGVACGEDIPKATIAGTYTVTYKVVGDDNHEDSTKVGSVTVTIKPKEVTSPKVTVSGTYDYDGSAKEPGTTNVKVEDGNTTIPDTEYTLSYRDNVNAGTATVIVTNANGGNYIVNGMGTFEIAKGTASVTTEPTGLENLPYNGTEQALIEAGTASNGMMVYSLSETGEYTPAIPTGKDVDNYTVWYKAQGDGNHNDSEAQSVTASIAKNTVIAPTIQVTPESVTYNGEKQEPAVTVKDDKGFVIDGSEYTVTYLDENNNSDLIQVGTYALTITGTGTHYDFTATADFEILPADQKPLTITGTRERVYYGDTTIQLGTTGSDGTVTWKVDNGPASIDENTGLLTITGVGSVTVTATSTKAGYADQTATWPFYVDKKQVTAVVTAADRAYTGDTTATLTVAISSGLVSGDDITGAQAEGHFTDKNVGENKTVIIDSLTFPDDINAKYDIVPPVTTTATIFKADVDETKVIAPMAAADLEYTGLPLTLVDTAGSSTEGTMEYSLDGKTYSASLPTGTSAGDYEVWYRVKGDGNHNDTAGTTLDNPVTIKPQEVADPIIVFTPSSASYDGAVHKPEVTVQDKNHRVIPTEEYTVSYGGTDWKTAGDHEVTITGKTGGNYKITTKTEKFIILMMGQNPLSITNQPGRVQYGDTFTLSTTGGSGTGAVTWVSSDTTVATIAANGLVTVLKSGAATITAIKAADDNYGAVSVTWSFSAEKKPVTPIVTARDKVYDETNSADLVVRWKDGDLLNGDSLALTLTGTFNDANVGTNKEVSITGTKPVSDKYEITLPTSTTASITPKAASLTGATNPELTYDGNPQPLVTGVTAANGTLAYSRNGAYYTLSVPKETNAGTYTVWYKAQADADGNYKDSPAICVEVTIKPKEVTNPEIDLSPESFEYDGAAKEPNVVVKDGNVEIPPSEYTVKYSNNINVGTNTAKVTITDNPGGNYNITGKTVTFSIKAGAPTLAGEPEPRSLTYNGREQTLVTRGTAVNGHMEYSFDEYDDYGTALPKGINAGIYEVWYKVVGDDGTETIPELVIAEIKQMPAIPTVTLELTSNPLPYTGFPQEPPVTVSMNGVPLNKSTYTVTYSNNINPGRAEVTVQSTSRGNYQFKDTTAFYIAKSKAEFSAPPEGLTDLVYTGDAQELIDEYSGTSLQGIVVYSLNAVDYSAEIPTGTKVRTYTIYAKVLGGSTHEDSDVVTTKATISKNVVTSPTVTLSQNSFKYDGTEHKPTVTVTDDNDHVIPAGEYTATYSDNINVGTATVTIKSKGTNYQLEATKTFQIVDGSQPILTITGKQDSVVYGDTLYLGATGGTGAVTWSSSDPDVAGINSSTGVVTTKKSGSVTVTAASGSLTDTWTFTVAPKPVTAVVIAAEKSYDTTTAATLTVILSGLVAGDIVDTVTATGHFMDANVGTNKTVIIDSLTIPDSVKEKYTVTAPPTTTGTISPAAAEVTDAPEAVTGLTYTGSPQALVSPGTAEGGELVYSVDGGSYSYNLPTAVNAGSYTIRYKVEAGDDNYKDSAVMKVENVTIGVNTDKPTVLCAPDTFRYDNTEKTPTVIVMDSQNNIISDSEYTVELPADRIEVGNYTVTVTDKPGGNYEFTDPATGTFEIVASSQNPLSITDKPASVRYGDTFTLSAIGGSGSGKIHWSIKEGNGVAEIDENGVVTVTGVGGFTVEAYREASDVYGKSNTDSVPFTAKPKPVTPVVTAADKPYDGKTNATLKASWKSGDLVGSDTITLTVGGAFATADAGTGKRVDITSHTAAGDAATKYAITWPESTTAQIYKVDAKLATVPTAPDLTYTGSAQNLVTGGTTEKGIGVVEYSTSEKGTYSTTIPTGTNAGTYTVWYKVADSVNYTGIPAASIEVEIKKATPTISTYPTASGTEGQSLSQMKLSSSAISVPGSFSWKDGSIKPGVGTSKQYVVFTPDDTTNYNTVEFQIDVTVQAATTPGNGTDSGTNATPPAPTNTTPPQTAAQDGTASAVVSAADGDKLVQEAVKNQSQTIVIKPEITGDVTKAQVSIPASTVDQIQSKTNATLTVSTPIADAAIPREALDALASAGGDVSVTAEQVGQSVTFTLAAGGETVEQIPGGLILTIPAKNAGPGTVAVLVHEDGAREILQRSIAEDGRMSIPLNGSAKIEIVDNSRTFSDVPAANWASEAVTFAAARELFSGTSETTFSPDETMSRAMLATVLYRLEGQPEQTAASAYSDVSSDAWYADSVAWAVENGIASGYGDGQFGPNDSVTREQFVVMLWRYMGSPKAGRRDLEFADADQISDYAQEALCWAVENGVLNGNDSGQLVPGGTATRAEAAQMLKNFMENI